MRVGSVYSLVTGLFTGHQYSSADDVFEQFIRGNCPPGTSWVEGRHDKQCKRVDLATREVIDYQPPQPSADHQWDGARWVLTAEALHRERQRRNVAAYVAVQEASQRALREAVLGMPGAMERLRAIDEAIAAVRPALK